MTPQEKEKAYRKLVRQQKVGVFLASSIIKRRRNTIDKIKVALLNAMASKADPSPDFMSDELCDLEPEFTIEELTAFRERR